MDVNRLGINSLTTVKSRIHFAGLAHKSASRQPHEILDQAI
jgi:hypothetical protein